MKKIKYEDVKIVMMDDGYCEYDRIGIGEIDGKVFICDLEFVDFSDLEYKEVFDDGSELKYFWFVNFDSVEECCLSGVKSGWCVEWKGVSEGDRFKFDMDKDIDCELFNEWVKENELA